jgi:hypothetical protein
MPRRECRGIGGVCQPPSRLIERTDFVYADLFSPHQTRIPTLAHGFCGSHGRKLSGQGLEESQQVALLTGR